MSRLEQIEHVGLGASPSPSPRPSPAGREPTARSSAISSPEPATPWWGEAPAEPEACPCSPPRLTDEHPSGSAGASPHRPTARTNRASSWVATTARKRRMGTMNPCGSPTDSGKPADGNQSAGLPESVGGSWRESTVRGSAISSLEPATPWWGEAPAEPEARPCRLTRSSKAHPSGSAGASPHRPTARTNRAGSWVGRKAVRGVPTGRLQHFRSWMTFPLSRRERAGVRGISRDALHRHTFVRQRPSSCPFPLRFYSCSALNSCGPV